MDSVKRVFLLGEKAHKLAGEVDCCFFSVRPITVEDVARHKPSHIICYGYRHIIKDDVIKSMPKNTIINLHPSFLPWGRGAHPNFWAWRNGEPHGVTIHAVDEGLDTGPIFVQRQVTFENYQNLTLADTYNLLEYALLDMFALHIGAIMAGDTKPAEQISSKQKFGVGSYHRVADLPVLRNGWATKISEIIGERRS